MNCVTRLISERISVYIAQISSKARSDFIYTGAAQGAGLVTSFFTALLITKRLGIDQLGAYALIISISSFVATLAEVGIGQTATRYASIAHANSELIKCNEVLVWSVNVRIIFAVASIVAGIYLSESLTTLFWKDGKSSEFIFHAFVLGAITILLQCANSYFQTHHNFRFLSLIILLNSALILGGALMLTWLGILSLESIIYMNMAAALVTLLAIILNTPWRNIYDVDECQRRSRFTLSFPISKKSSGPVDDAYGIKPQNFAVYLLASSLIVTIFTRLDVWMISALLSESEVGVYKLASYFAIPLALVVGALNTTLWPRASKLITQVLIRRFIRRTVQISLLLMLPMGFYIISLNWLTNFIFPTQATLINGLSIALSIRYLLAALITPVAVVGYTLGMSRVYVFVNSLQLAVVFVIVSIFINDIGLYAPAIALIVSELISIFIIWPLLRKRVRGLATA